MHAGLSSCLPRSHALYRSKGSILKQACKVAALAIIAILFIRLSPAHGSPKVLFTVDVESKGKLTLPAQMDGICDDGSACGLMEIVRMLSEYRIAGIFFLNVYEHTCWGKEALRNITMRLLIAGQDVALHTHPGTAYDPSRMEMYEYTLDEQTAIIRDGAQLLASWTGQSAVAHRAGNYSADERTLDALERNGVHLDSSVFWGHPQSRLNSLHLPRNLPALRGKLIELPITVYQREERPKHFGGVFRSYHVHSENRPELVCRSK
jgi:hypothetical protein